MSYRFLLYTLACLSISTMAASLPPLKTFKVSDGYNYGYVHIKARRSNPTFLLLHGFPSSVVDWHRQITDLSTAGYGVIALDLLGYGETDKPAAVEEYRFSKMSNQVAEILEHEGLRKVIGVGHDWGSGLLGKFVNYLPKYFSSLVFVSVPYQPGGFDLDAANRDTEAAFGYPIFGYMPFFNETDAAQVLDAHVESFLSLAYPELPDRWRTDLCPIGKARAWVESGKVDKLPSWETKKERDDRIKLFTKGGFTGPLNWYKVQIRNIDAPAFEAIPPENIVLNIPVLFVGGDQDYATRSEIMYQVADLGKQQGWLPTVEVKIIAGASHWLLLEKPKEIFTILDKVAKNLK